MVAVILAVVFGGERLALPGIAGVVLTIGGVVLVSAIGQPDAGQDFQRTGRGRGDGVPYALVAMVSWGVTIYFLGRTSEDLGWFLPVAVCRAITFVIILAVAAVVFLRRPSARPRPGTLLLPAYTRATAVGSVAVTAAASASFPLIVIAGGIVVFRERLHGRQILGTGMTLAGLLVLGLTPG